MILAVIVFVTVCIQNNSNEIYKVKEANLEKYQVTLYADIYWYYRSVYNVRKNKYLEILFY